MAKAKAPAKVDAIKGAQAKALRETMGKRVRAARRALDLSQGALGEAFGKTYGWIGGIESGRAFAPPYLIATLQKATGQPHAWFFGEGDVMAALGHAPG